MRLKENQIEVGCLYLTTLNQYRAVLAMKGEFMIYAPSLEGASPVNLSPAKMPFENQPFKKCQIVTFAKKDYQLFNSCYAVGENSRHAAPSTGVFVGNSPKGRGREAALCRRDKDVPSGKPRQKCRSAGSKRHRVV